MKSDVAMPVANWLTLVEVLQRWLITSTIKLRAKSDSVDDIQLKLSKSDWKQLHKLLEQIKSQTIPLEEKSACRFGRRLIIVGRLIKQLGSHKEKSSMAKTKKEKKMKKGKQHEQAVVEAVASDNGTVATETGEKKKKKYQRSVRVRAAGEVAKFLVYNAKNFRGRYEGEALYSFKVDMDDKAFLDDLLDRLELDKK